MKSIIKLAVIGGTGKSGRYVVQHLLRTGQHFKILLRHPENSHLNNPLIEVVKGDARDPEAIDRLLQGCDAVVSTLGQPKGEPSIFSEATSHVLAAMDRHRIKRYVVTTGLMVDAPGDRKGERSQAATAWMHKTYPETTQDKQKEFDLLSASSVDWTLVRLPLIDQTDEQRPLSISLEDCPGESISATDLAAFVVGQLSDNSYIQKAPFIANV